MNCLVTMKNFVIFYQEKMKDNIDLKLINTYMNPLCIDEEDQNEVLEPIAWEPMSFGHLEHIFFLPNLAMRFIYFSNKVLLKNKISLSESLGLLSAIHKWINTKKGIYGKNFPLHFFITLPMIDFAVPLIRMSIIPVIAGTFSSNCSLTLLQGRRESLSSWDEFPKEELTIGDDIELLFYQLQNSSLAFSIQSKSSSVYTTVDETLMKIECERKFYTIEFTKSCLTAVVYLSRGVFVFLILIFTIDIPVNFFIDQIMKDIYEFVTFTVMFWFLSRIMRFVIYCLLLVFVYAFELESSPRKLILEILFFLFFPMCFAAMFLLYVYLWIQNFSDLTVSLIKLL